VNIPKRYRIEVPEDSDADITEDPEGSWCHWEEVKNLLPHKMDTVHQASMSELVFSVRHDLQSQITELKQCLAKMHMALSTMATRKVV